MSRSWIVFIIAVLGGLWLHGPAPEGFSRPWAFKMHVGAHKASTAAMSIVESLGICSLEEGLEIFLSLTLPTPNIPDHLMVGDEIADGVQVRVYRPRTVSSSGGYPGFVFYHGGGWVAGNTYVFDPFMLDIASSLTIVIMSVEYRLAPKHKYPIPLEDCLTATRYFLKNPKHFDVDSRRVAIGGDSAGGNLAAAVSLRLRDENFNPFPKRQILIYPVLQGLDTKLPSYQQVTNGFLANLNTMSRVISYYAVGSLKYASAVYENTHVTANIRKKMFNSKIRHNDLPIEYHYAPYKKPYLDKGNEDVWNEVKDIISSPYFSPLLADDLSGLPDAYVFTAQYDVLRDEGLLYVKRLREAGNNVTHLHGVTSVHAACTIRHNFPVEGGECVDGITSYLKTL